jgi:uncharacterized protein (DUF2336 family)
VLVRQILDWVEREPNGQPAHAAYALARACLFAPADSDHRAALEAALTVLIDKGRPDVREAIANALAESPAAPRHLVAALATDQASIAAPLVARSPGFIDGELIDLLSGGSTPVCVAIASRPTLSAAVVAAIAESGERDACLALLHNSAVAIDATAHTHIATRLGDDAAIRRAQLDRHDVPAQVRQALVRCVADSLAAFVVGKSWLGESRAAVVSREACERATVTIASETEAGALPALIEHLRATGQLTTALMLRAACTGHFELFEAALSRLADVPLERTADVVRSGKTRALHAIYSKARLPEQAFDAFAAAIDTWGQFSEESGDYHRSSAELADTILTRYAGASDADGGGVVTMLRRFAAEQAREAAHEYARAAA